MSESTRQHSRRNHRRSGYGNRYDRNGHDDSRRGRNYGRERDRSDARRAIDEILDEVAELRFSEKARGGALGLQLAEYAHLGYLLKLMNSRKAMIRFTAVEALRQGEYDFNDRVIDSLLDRIDDYYDFVAVAAINTLGQRGIVEAADDLVDCLGVDDKRIASAALVALGDIGDDELPDHVEEFLNSDEPYRIRAAAQVIGRLEMKEFSHACFELLGDLREEAWIEPETHQHNPYLLAARELVRSLGMLKFKAAVPLLKELSTSHYGLRSFSMRALQEMELDDEVRDLARQAYEQHPSSKVGRILDRVDEGFDSEAERGRRMSDHLVRNQGLLEELGDDFDVGTIVRGTAGYVHRKYAIIETETGVAALLHIMEYSWTRTTNLRDFEDELREPNEYKVISVKRDEGKVELSRRELTPDPMVAFREANLGPVFEGTVDSVAKFGVFVELAPQIIGLLHRTELNIRNNQMPYEFYRVGDPVRVRIISEDQDTRRIQLTLDRDEEDEPSDEEE